MFFSFFALRSLSSVVSSKSSTPPFLHLLSASLLSVISSFSAFAPCPSIIFIHACLGCTVWIFLLEAVVETHFFMWPLNLYSWPWIRIRRGCSGGGVMSHHTRLWRESYLCLYQLGWARVAGTRWRLDSDEGKKKKKESYWICVWLAVVFWSSCLICDADLTQESCLLSGDEYWMQKAQRLKENKPVAAF